MKLVTLYPVEPKYVPQTRCPVDENFTKKTEVFDGLIARVIQHEYDHIEGILFTDHLTTLKKTLIKKKLQNIMEGKARPDYRMKFANKKGR